MINILQKYFDEIQNNDLIGLKNNLKDTNLKLW